MTKEELKQIPALKLEIRLIRAELQDLPYVTDCVTGSDTEFPYTSHVIKIQGADEDRAKQLRGRLTFKLAKLQDKLCEMEDWLDGIPDTEIRVILRLKFVDELSNLEIGEKLGYEKSTISKKTKKIFEEK